MKLSVIIPCYNELSRGEGTTSFRSRLDSLRNSIKNIDGIEVILVDDCSDDDSSIFFDCYVAEYNLSNWKCIVLDSNKGKGKALLEGFKISVGYYVCFLDADMSVSPSHIYDIHRMILYYMMQGRYVCFIGTRFSKDSKIINKRSVSRKFVSKCTRFLLNISFNLNVSDTQCGFKVFPRKVIEDYLDIIYPSRWLLDIELLYIMKLRDVEFHEYSVEWNNLENSSTVKLSDAIVKSLIDLLKILKLKKAIRNVK